MIECHYKISPKEYVELSQKRNSPLEKWRGCRKRKGVSELGDFSSTTCNIMSLCDISYILVLYLTRTQPVCTTNS